jgi:hypothetical protein
MMRTLAFLSTLAAFAGGCTFGQEPIVTYEVRNAALRGELDGARVDVLVEEQVEVGSPDEAVASISITDAVSRQLTTLEFDGNMEALCPGMRARFERQGEALRLAASWGAPDEMRDDLNALQISMLSERPGAVNAPSYEADELTFEISREDGQPWSLVTFQGMLQDGSEQAEVEGSFEVVRVERSPSPRADGTFDSEMTSFD